MKRRPTQESWAFRGVEFAVPAVMAVAAVTLLFAFVTSSDVLVSDIARVVSSFAAEQPRPTLIADAPSVCCEGFYAGGLLALVGVLLGGIPLAVVGFVLARRTDRTGSSSWTTPWTLVVQSCLVFQLMNLALAGFLVVIALYTFTPVGPFVIGMSGLLVFLLANVATSALAVPAWRIVQRSLRSHEDLGIGR